MKLPQEMAFDRIDRYSQSIRSQTPMNNITSIHYEYGHGRDGKGRNISTSLHTLSNKRDDGVRAVMAQPDGFRWLTTAVCRCCCWCAIAKIHKDTSAFVTFAQVEPIGDVCARGYEDALNIGIVAFIIFINSHVNTWATHVILIQNGLGHGHGPKRATATFISFNGGNIATSSHLFSRKFIW